MPLVPRASDSPERDRRNQLADETRAKNASLVEHALSRQPGAPRPLTVVPDLPTGPPPNPGLGPRSSPPAPSTQDRIAAAEAAGDWKTSAALKTGVLARRVLGGHGGHSDPGDHLPAA